MRILICGVSRFLQPTGICRHAVNLANCLVAHDSVSSVALVIGKWQESYHREYLSIDPRVELISISGSNSPYWRNTWYIFGLPAIAKQKKADIVHMAFPMPLRSRLDSAVVASVHDLYPFSFPANNSSLVRTYKKSIMRQCLFNADGIGVVSNATLASLLAYLPDLRKQNIRLVPNYAVLAKSQQKPGFLRGLEKFVLCVAQHEANKQLDLALSLFAKLVEFGSKALSGTGLVVVGSTGSQTEKLRKLAAELGISGRVFWAPPLNDFELAWLYRNCEVFLSTSALEGFCLPLAEAVASGARVACTDIPSHREVAGPLPQYFAVNALPEQAAEAVLQSLQRGKPECARNFTARNTCAAALELYAQSIAQSKAAKHREN